jgi:Mce-associated membrane protein
VTIHFTKFQRRGRHIADSDSVSVKGPIVSGGADEAGDNAINDPLAAAQDGSPVVAEALDAGPPTGALSIRPWRRKLVFVILPVVALAVAATAGYLRWQAGALLATRAAAAESVQAATDATIQMLSYHPDTVDRDLNAARDRMTGAFRDDYTKLTNEVVIPGAKQKHISSLATVPAASSVSASPDHAVVLVFINQSIVMGSDPPTNTASSVKVSMEKHDRHWLISSFDPV